MSINELLEEIWADKELDSDLTFEDYLAGCSAETQVRFGYLETLLEEAEEELHYIFVRRITNKVDIDIMEKLGNYENWNETISEKQELEKLEEEVEKRYEVILEMLNDLVERLELNMKNRDQFERLFF